MKIFISWSGSISKKIADAFRQWIPGVIQAARPYYSPDDISKGSRWSSEIAKELENSKVGIICLTKDNLQAPWIMFEAGALSKNLEIAKVCPILFGVEPSEIQGPLIQFQAARFSKDEVKKVIRMINAELGDNGLAPDVLDSVFDMWWPKLKETVEAIMKENSNSNEKNVRSERDILEEVLELTRAAHLAKERPTGKDKRINPQAVFDLVNGMLKVSMEVQAISETHTTYKLIEELDSLLLPIKHIVNRVDSSEDLQRKLLSVLSEAEALIKNHWKIILKGLVKENDSEIIDEIGKDIQATKE